MVLAPLAATLLSTVALDTARLEKLLGFTHARADEPTTTLAAGPTVKLLGTLKSATAGWSLALVVSGTRARTVTIGTQVDGWELEDVGHRCVSWARDEARATTCMNTRSEPDQRPVSALVGGVVTIDPQELAQVIGTQATQIATTTRVDPVLEAGQWRGFRVSFPATSPLRRLGLEPGDVITTLDGQPLTPAVAVGLLSGWHKRTQAQVDLLRGGQPRHLALQLGNATSSPLERRQ
jgi:type II secretory pathway component PulC